MGYRPAPPPPSPSDRPAPVTSRTAIPTNKIFYNGKSREARIDPEAKVAVVVEMMSTVFQTREHHITLCLRDEADHLVTNHNLKHRVQAKANLKLSPSPMTEALAVVESLQLTSSQGSFSDSTVSLVGPGDRKVLSLKLALFNLQKYIKEGEFVVEFLMKGGLPILIKMMEKDQGGLSGNSLAYALQGVRGILEFESGWSDISVPFINRVIHLLLHSSAPNILRPATAITRKLVISSPHFSGDPNHPKTMTPAYKARSSKKSKGKERAVPLVGQGDSDPAGRYGFERMYERMGIAGQDLEGEEGTGIMRFFRVIIKRLEGTGDLELVAQSLGLINVCLRCADQESSPQYTELVTTLESLPIRRPVSRLIPTSANNIVSAQILNFQARYISVLNHRRLRQVRLAHGTAQERMMTEIWHCGRLGEDLNQHEAERLAHTGEGLSDATKTWAGWSKLGVDMGDDRDAVPHLLEIELFRDVGELGLECLHWFAMHEDSFHNSNQLVIQIEGVRLGEQGKPASLASDWDAILTCSAECVKILCEHYKVSQAGLHTPPHFQLFLLNFPRLHQLVMRFFLRMWRESNSRLDDLGRLSFLVKSQLRLSLQDEASKSWLHLERDFLETPYSTIRERQMELLEKEDGMLNRPAVKDLRQKLTLEAYDVMREQRIGCMLHGAWFNAANVIVKGIMPSVKPSTVKPYRFLRLSTDRKTIAWDDFAARTVKPPPYHTLREHIDIANISDIRVETGCAVGSRSPNLVTKYSFSLITGHELSLLDVDAVHVYQFAEWTDGIRALFGKGHDDGRNSMVHAQSLDKIKILAEVALKVRLLDITGDGVEIPEKIPIGPGPRSTDFWFA